MRSTAKPNPSSGGVPLSSPSVSRPKWDQKQLNAKVIVEPVYDTAVFQLLVETYRIGGAAPTLIARICDAIGDEKAVSIDQWLPLSLFLSLSLYVMWFVFCMVL
jgi:hypothetical protein